MIKANGEPQFLPLYEALASEVRWRIMDMIADREMNVKDIAAVLELSPSIVTMHIRKLEEADLIGSRRVRINGEHTNYVTSSKIRLRSSCHPQAKLHEPESR